MHAHIYFGTYKYTTVRTCKIIFTPMMVVFDPTTVRANVFHRFRYFPARVPPPPSRAVWQFEHHTVALVRCLFGGRGGGRVKSTRYDRNQFVLLQELLCTAFTKYYGIYCDRHCGTRILYYLTTFRIWRTLS